MHSFRVSRSPATPGGPVLRVMSFERRLVSDVPEHVFRGRVGCAAGASIPFDDRRARRPGRAALRGYPMLSRYDVTSPFSQLWLAPSSHLSSTMNRLFQDFETAFVRQRP